MISAKLSRPVAILGLGLIGGSLLRDLHAAGAPAYGWNRSPLDTTFDVTDSLEDTLRRAARDDALIVLATPMPAISSLLDALTVHAPTAVFTDVVSVKGAVFDLVRERGLSDNYVGGHPMAGTAESGWDASQTGLFEDAAWVVTYDHALEACSPRWTQAFSDVIHLANLVGAHAIPALAARHDSAVARISHLPHLLAEALALVGDAGGPLALSLAAGSFRDGTRVAGTAPDLVRAMCENNSDALLGALDEALAILQEARVALAGGSVSELAVDGNAAYERYRARGAGSRPVFRLLPGEEGWVSQLQLAEQQGARIHVM